ncbi:cysteine-rich CWC family protein [Lysinibacillus sp. MHQ-1]|nr:cysteine-rich CWC family protein [Lysinibacillus sp. MHQ-1]
MLFLFFLYNDEIRKGGLRLCWKNRCPRCGRENHCGVAKGEKECWCMTENFSRAIVKYYKDEYMYLSSMLKYI